MTLICYRNQLKTKNINCKKGFEGMENYAEE